MTQTQPKHESDLAEDCTIADLAARYAVSPRALRLYESKELIRPRRVGSARLYSEQDRMLLELTLAGKRLGFTLAQIREILQRRDGGEDMTSAEFAMLLTRAEIEVQIDRLERRRDGLNCAIDDLIRAHKRLDPSHGPAHLRVVDER